VRELLGDDRGALADLSEALRLTPSDARVHVARGELRAGLGDAPGAAADLERALELDPGARWAPAARRLLERQRAAAPDSGQPPR